MLNMITANMEFSFICNLGFSHHSDICLRPHHDLEPIMHGREASLLSIVATKNIPMKSGFEMTVGSGRHNLELTGGQNHIRPR
jgi:hypothetical protein